MSQESLRRPRVTRVGTQYSHELSQEQAVLLELSFQKAQLQSWMKRGITADPLYRFRLFVVVWSQLDFGDQGCQGHRRYDPVLIDFVALWALQSRNSKEAIEHMSIIVGKGFPHFCLQLSGFQFQNGCRTLSCQTIIVMSQSVSQSVRCSTRRARSFSGSPVSSLSS